MKLKFHIFDLKLKHTFKIAHDERSVQKTLIVELSNEEYSGFGEATASRYYGNSIESMISLLEEHRALIESYRGENPAEFWDKTNSALSTNSFAQCAVDVAVNDLYGKILEKPLHEIWKSNGAVLPTSNYTIGIDSIENMIKKMKEQPWPKYKIKLGTKEDINIIKKLREHTTSIFRVDANCAWGVDETIANAKELSKCNVQFIEQPLAADNWEGMKTVFKNSELPVIADESCINESDVDKCYNYFHGVNIKLMKCGGLTPARRMIKRAKDLGLKSMVGCMTESSVGISAIAQLLPELDYVDMDGFMLIENDLAEGPKLEDGKIIVPKGNGTGVVFKGM